MQEALPQGDAGGSRGRRRLFAKYAVLFFRRKDDTVAGSALCAVSGHGHDLFAASPTWRELGGQPAAERSVGVGGGLSTADA